MDLDARGHPLHTRALGITLAQRPDGHLDATGTLLDLRKRGFVPVGGELQPAGIVHHMILEAVVDPAGPTLVSVAARQPSVAFEPTALTRGESCRDPVGRVAALAGARLDDGFDRRLADEIGGPRGCSHVLTLAHLLGASVRWALARDRALLGTPARLPGQRIFRRDVVVDGSEGEGSTLLLALQLTDLHHAPTPEPAPPMERFGAALEVRGLATFDLTRYALAHISLAERRREGERLDAPWQQRNDVAAGLAGLSLARGVSSALLARLGSRPDDQPLLDGLLMLAPTLIQVFAALSDGWPAVARAQGWMVGMGGRPDSCYMWRRGGALEAARSPGDPPYMGGSSS